MNLQPYGDQRPDDADAYVIHQTEAEAARDAAGKPAGDRCEISASLRALTDVNTRFHVAAARAEPNA